MFELLCTLTVVGMFIGIILIVFMLLGFVYICYTYEKNKTKIEEKHNKKEIDL